LDQLRCLVDLALVAPCRVRGLLMLRWLPKRRLFCKRPELGGAVPRIEPFDHVALRPQIRQREHLDIRGDGRQLGRDEPDMSTAWIIVVGQKYDVSAREVL